MRNTPNYFARQKALTEGRERYSTGFPCKRGHISERNTGNRHCIACQKEFIEKHKAPVRIHEKKVPVKISDMTIPGARVFIDGKQVI